MAVRISSQVPGAGTLGGGADCVRTNWPVLSPQKLSATMNVMVGFTAEKVPNPREASVDVGSVRLLGGVALPAPFVTLVGNTQFIGVLL